MRKIGSVAATALTLGVALPLAAQEAAPAAKSVTVPVTVSCSSKPGERQDCPADTSKGVVLARSYGEAPCLLGKTWGYDDKGVWVSDGCSGEFVVGREAAGGGEEEAKKKPLEYIPNARVPARSRARRARSTCGSSATCAT